MRVVLFPIVILKTVIDNRKTPVMVDLGIMVDRAKGYLESWRIIISGHDL